MIVHDLKQGSQEWHQHRAMHFNASDAPAMMGKSKYKTRNQLLHEYATGLFAEVDADTQRRFDDGHRFEALARPLAEEIIGQELYPIVGSDGKYSASFDGLTAGDDIGFEHKSLNDEIRACQDADELDAMYRIQMEQQLMVSGAEKILFLATRWDDNDMLLESKHFWYLPNLVLRKAIVAGWRQFEADLAAYTPPATDPVVLAAPVLALPAVSIQVNGSIALQSNLDLFGEKLRAYVEGLNKTPDDDQGFADAEAAIKTLEKAQEALEAAESGALAQTASIDEMRRTVALYKELARTTRLSLEKMVKQRKESIRADIVAGGIAKFSDHVRDLNTRIGKPYMSVIAVNFTTVIKGKKTLVSLRDAVDTELARAKIEANAVADRIQVNMNLLRDTAKDHAFLFADAGQIVLKAEDDFAVLVKSRIAEHKAAKAKEEEETRERIRKEEEAKAEAKVKAEAEAKIKAEQEATPKAAVQASQMPDTGTTGNERPSSHFTTTEPLPVTAATKPAVKLTAQGIRPTDGDMIAVLALHYRVDGDRIIHWLRGMDLNEQERRMAKEFAA